MGWFESSPRNQVRFRSLFRGFFILDADVIRALVSSVANTVMI